MTTIRRYKIASGAISAGGAATAYSDVIRGKILCVEVDYPANTCTVDLDSEGPVAQKILDLSAANTDVVLYPRTPSQDHTGTDVTYDGSNEIYEPFIVYGRIKLTLASGTEAQEVSVYLTVEEL